MLAFLANIVRCEGKLSQAAHSRQVAVLPHGTFPRIPDRSPAFLMFRLGRGHLYSRYWARLLIGFCHRGSRSKRLTRIRERKSSAGKSATEPPFSGASEVMSIASRCRSIFSRRRTFRIASRPTSSRSPHKRTGSPVAWARSTSSVKSARGRLWAPRGAVESNQAGGRQDRSVFFTLGQADCGCAGRVYWVETPELPTITDHARIPPLGVTPPMPPTQPVIPLVLDCRARGCQYSCEIFRGRKRAYRRQIIEVEGRSRAWCRWRSPGD